MSDEHHSQEHLSGRVRDVTEELREQLTTLEQERPHKPSFLLVVILSGVVLIILFILAIVVLHLGGGRFGRHSFRKNPTSQLILPAPPTVADRVA